MYSSSLLAHLSKSFAPHPENIATEALGHILMNSPLPQTQWLRCSPQWEYPLG